MDLKETIRYIQHAEFFIGLSSGLSWVANAIGVPTVLISNVTSHDHEFNGENVVRITDESVCHGCFHTETFDANDWAWCPLHKDTEKHFICSKVITADKVLLEIKRKGLV
jgi:autotransporter strand-loop-strand O-heptosyltransferase